MRNLALILSGVLFNAIGQLLLNQGVESVGHIDLDRSGLRTAGVRLATTPWIWLGICSFMISFALWLVVLSRVDVGFATPFFSLGFVFVAVAGSLLFGERLTLGRIAGIAIICVGVTVLSRG